jgi:hypothetical protein
MTGHVSHAHPPKWSENLGWFPALALVMAVGLLAISFAFNAARQSLSWAPVGFWVSLLFIILPPVARLLQPNVHRTERLALTLAFGLALYWVSILRSPTQLTGYDEISNLRTLLDILVSGRLFRENPLLLVNALYPALGSTTAAVTQVSGMDPFSATVVVMGLMRVILVLGTFLLFESVSGSAWVGAVGSLLYMTNPDFLFFNSAYIYESFALPFTIVVLWLLVERQAADSATRTGLTFVALLCLAGIVMGHHLTTMALVGALVVWTAATAFRRWRGDAVGRAQGVGGMAAITIIAFVTWSLYVATEMIKYLGSLFLTTVQGFIGFITGSGPGRALFEPAPAAPPEERVLALAATVTIVVALPIGLLILWRTLRTRPDALLLGVVALGYPASQALRLTSSGGLEVASRANSFVFVGVAFAIALLAVGVVRRAATASRRILHVAAISLVMLMFGGGVVLGSSWYDRLPGPFLVGGESRAISPQGDAAAAWMLAQLGPDQRVAADRTNRLLLGSTGLQRVVFDARDPVGLLPLYADTTLDPPAIFVLRDQRIRYVLVDRRLSTALPLVGLYFDQAELRDRRTAPIPATALGKFDRDDRVDRIYDSGDLQLYDTGTILGE